MNKDSESAAYGEVVDYVGTSLRFLFSWVVLMSIAVIVSGKITGAVFKLPDQSRQLFRIAIPRVFNIEAHGHEVVVGFAAFFVNFLAIAGLAGQPAYRLFTEQFGLDPGQFNALCILSSFTSVTASVLLVATMWLFGKLRPRTDAGRREYESAVERLAGERSGREDARG